VFCAFTWNRAIWLVSRIVANVGRASLGVLIKEQKRSPCPLLILFIIKDNVKDTLWITNVLNSVYCVKLSI